MVLIPQPFLMTLVQFKLHVQVVFHYYIHNLAHSFQLTLLEAPLKQRDHFLFRLGQTIRLQFAKSLVVGFIQKDVFAVFEELVLGLLELETEPFVLLEEVTGVG